MEQKYVTKIPAEFFLTFSLFLNLIGFGFCTVNFIENFEKTTVDGTGFFALMSLSHFVATISALFAIRICVINNPKNGIRYKLWHQILIILIALALAGWGGFVTFIGISTLVSNLF